MGALPGTPNPRPATDVGPDHGSQRAVLVAAGLLGLVLLAAGVILWSSRGQTVFVDMLASALALCF